MPVVFNNKNIFDSQIFAVGKSKANHVKTFIFVALGKYINH